MAAVNPVQQLKDIIETTCRHRRIPMAEAHQWDLAVKAFLTKNSEEETIDYLAEQLGIHEHIRNS